MHTEKSIATILSETKEELKQFVATRVSMLKAEMDEKISRLKAVIPLAVVAALFMVSFFRQRYQFADSLRHGQFSYRRYKNTFHFCNTCA